MQVAYSIFKLNFIKYKITHYIYKSNNLNLYIRKGPAPAPIIVSFTVLKLFKIHEFVIHLLRPSI